MTTHRATRSVNDVWEATLLAVIDRVEQVLLAEEAALRRHDLGQIAAFTTRKAQCLLELSRAMKFDWSPSAQVRIRPPLLRLRDHIATNMHLIEVNLKAVTHVARQLAQTLNSADADGTYTADVRKRAAT